MGQLLRPENLNKLIGAVGQMMEDDLNENNNNQNRNANPLGDLINNVLGSLQIDNNNNNNIGENVNNVNNNVETENFSVIYYRTSLFQ